MRAQHPHARLAVLSAPETVSQHKRRRTAPLNLTNRMAAALARNIRTNDELVAVLAQCKTHAQRAVAVGQLRRYLKFEVELTK